MWLSKHKLTLCFYPLFLEIRNFRKAQIILKNLLFKFYVNVRDFTSEVKIKFTSYNFRKLT